MKYLSTHKVLTTGYRKVIIPTILLFFALMILAVFVGMVVDSTLGIIIAVFGVIFSIFVYQHIYLNWLVWAVKYVDDIPQLLRDGGGYDLININNFPAVNTIFPYTEKKKKIENTVFERKEKGLYVVELNNVPYYTETHFYKSVANYIFLLLLGLFFLSVWFIVPTEHLLVNLMATASGLLISYIALKNIFDREPAFSISRFGVKTRKTNLQWDEIEDITVVRNIKGSGKHRTVVEDIKITYREKDGTLNFEKINISSIKTSIAKADEVIKAYKQKYMKSNVE